VAGIASDSERSIVILREKDGERILPVVMSTRRALTLMMRTKLSLPVPVPASVPDLTFHLLRKFDITLSRVVLTTLKDGVFFCTVVAEREGQEQQLDYCLAADGLVMATTACCPIMIESQLMEAQYMHKVGDNSFSLNINTLTQKMVEDALQHAVENENYEVASLLRDELAKRTASSAPYHADNGDDPVLPNNPTPTIDAE